MPGSTDTLRESCSVRHPALRTNGGIGIVYLAGIACLFACHFSSIQRVPQSPEVASVASDVMKAKSVALLQIEMPYAPVDPKAEGPEYKVIRRWSLEGQAGAAARQLFGEPSNFLADDPLLRTKLAFIEMFILQFDNARVHIDQCSMWMVFEKGRRISEIVSARKAIRRPIATLLAELAGEEDECLGFHLGKPTPSAVR